MAEMKKEVFTEDEKAVLKKHVTNINDDIYCIKNLPEEVVAVLFAYVSRSPNSFKRNLLILLGSGDLDLGKGQGEAGDGNAGDASSIGVSGIDAEDLTKAKEKAKKFHEKWVVGYGHGSVAEHASIKFAIDKLSIIATKILEDNRLGSYTEKSTRYQLFDKNVFFWDEKLMSCEYAEEVKQVVSELFDVYEKFQPIVKEYVKQRNPRKEGVNERAYENSIYAKVCDIVRYLLPAGTLTSMGFTFNARTAEHAISKLLSHPLKEAQDIGKRMLEEGSKICPTLLMFAGYNKFYAETNNEMMKIAPSFAGKNAQQRITGAQQILIDAQQKITDTQQSIGEKKIDTSTESYKSYVKTIFFDENADDKIVAAILYEFSQMSYENVFAKVKTLSFGEKEKIVDEYLKRRGLFDRPMRALEHAYFTMEIVCDYGAFRDIQRHRMNTQTTPLFSTHLGYEIPEEIVELGKSDNSIIESYISVMEKVNSLYNKLSKKYPYESQYIIPLAFRKQVLFTWNIRELEHFIRLRSSVQGHISYRRVAQKCWEEVNKTYPLFAKYIALSMDEEYLGRLRAEIETQNLIQKAKEKYG